MLQVYNYAIEGIFANDVAKFTFLKLILDPQLVIQFEA